MIFFGSPFPTKRSTKNPQKFGENSERNSGQNPGQKFEKFGELSFCDFSDLTYATFPEYRACISFISKYHPHIGGIMRILSHDKVFQIIV